MAAKKDPPRPRRRKAHGDDAGVPRHNTPPRFEGAKLRAEVRAFCEREYELFTYVKWDPQAYPNWATLEGIYEARKQVALHCAKVRRLLDELGRAERHIPRLTLEDLIGEATQRLDKVAPDVPASTLLGFAVQRLELTQIPDEVPIDRRLATARQPPPDIYWRLGPGRHRGPSDRELACITLLIGHWPDLRLGAHGAGYTPEEVVRQEANAIASILRRRKRGDDTEGEGQAEGETLAGTGEATAVEREASVPKAVGRASEGPGIAGVRDPVDEDDGDGGVAT